MPTATTIELIETLIPGGDGIPAGGTTGQVLKKQSGDDYDVGWDDESGGGGGGSTNLSATASPTGVTVASSTGADATLPLATGTNAGLQSPAQFTAVANLATTYQPLDADLTIAALTTTSFGRSLLALLDANALAAAAGQEFVDATGLVAALSSDTTVGEANRAALQTQLDAAIIAGKALRITSASPVTYHITFVNDTVATVSGRTYRRGVRFNSPTLPASLWIGPNVTIKLCDGQFLVNNTRGGMFFTSNRSGRTFIGWPFGGRGEGGRIEGNAANQVVAYNQQDGYNGILTIAGGGSQNVHVHGLTIGDFKSHAIEVMADVRTGGQNVALDDARTSLTRDIAHTGLVLYDCGEHVQVSNTHNYRFGDSRVIGTNNVQAGDGVEPVACYNAVIYNSDFDNGDTIGAAAIGTGGCWCDPAGTKNAWFLDCRVKKWKAAVQGVSITGDSGLIYGDNFNYDNCHFEDIADAMAPLDGPGRTVMRNITAIRCNTAGLMLSWCYANTTASRLILENFYAEECGGIQFGDTGGVVEMRNVRLTRTTADVNSVALGVFGETLVLDVDGFTAKGYQFGYGSNGGWEPAGRLANFNVVGCVHPKRVYGSSSLANLSIPDELIGQAVAPFRIDSYNVAPFDNTIDEYPWQGYRFTLGVANGASLTTLGAGHKDQTLTVLVPAGESQTYRHGTGDLFLAGERDAPLIGPTALTIRWDGTRWVELQRQVSTLTGWQPNAVAGVKATIVPAISRDQRRMWKDSARTQLATEHGELVYAIQPVPPW
jgi:hypothetical protein